MPGSSNLWTPNGIVPLHEKNVVAIDLHELRTLANMHELAQRHGFTVRCEKCGQPIRGENNGYERTASVACHCREFRFTSAG